jgi:hypothetical protein
MKAYRQFDEALELGFMAQDRVKDVLEDNGAYCSRVDKARHKFDFQCLYNSNTFKVEVKDESAYRNSGNICVETGQGRWKRKPSGIAVTRADLCIHVLGDKVVIYQSSEMLNHCRELYRGGVEERRFGDNGNIGYIIKIRDMLGFKWFDWLPFSSLHSSELWAH